MAQSKIYLSVPFSEKDTAKALGAKWDPAKKKWYASKDRDISLFAKWTSDQATPSLSNLASKKTSQGVTTKPKDKNFSPYAGSLPPWS